MNANNVSAASPKISGAVYSGPTSSTLPTDAISALASTLKELGYIGDDGIVNGNGMSTNDIKAWGGDIVGTTSEGKTDTFKLKLLEVLNVDVLKSVYGEANVTGDLTTGIKVKANAKDTQKKAWVFDMVLSDDILKRIVIPSAKITALEDISYKNNEPIGYAITLTAYPDKDGQTHYEYIVKANTTGDDEQ